MRQQSILPPVLLLVLTAWSVAKDTKNPKQTLGQVASVEIHLHDLGYSPTPLCRYTGSGIPHDVSKLYDDYKERLTFIDNKTVAVYQTVCPLQGQDDHSPDSRSMEAIFVSSQDGVFISRKSWPTIKRRWLNDRWDTQARIMPVRDGFLVHAGSSLKVYSVELQQRAELALESDPRWAATIAPQGHTIHLQRIENDNRAEGTWLTSDSLTRLRSQREAAGSSSASDEAIADKLSHCVQLQTVGEPPRKLFCADPSHLGLPLFLTNSEILSIYGSGFSVWSTKGDKLWTQEVPHGRPVGNQRRALDGGRFGVLITGRVLFDQVAVPAGKQAILIYDRAKRTQIFHVIFGHGAELVDFALSPDGRILAILRDDTIGIYRIPE
jgi:hypothetical protein